MARESGFSLTWRARAADVTTEKWGNGDALTGRRASVAALVPTDRRGAARLSRPAEHVEGAAPSGTETTTPRDEAPSYLSAGTTNP